MLPRRSRVLPTNFVNSHKTASLHALEASSSSIVPDAFCLNSTASRTRAFSQGCVDAP